METVPWQYWYDALASVIDKINLVWALFTTPPVVYFVALAFVGAAVHVSRKLVPMKKR